MIFQTLWVLKALALIAIGIIVFFLPVISMLLYGKLARKGRVAFDWKTHDRIERNENIIFYGGYFLMLVIFLFTIAPKAIG